MKQVFADIGVPESRPFQPDPFQIQALEEVCKNDCLVTAPTGSGKTWIAVEAIAKVFSEGGNAWYASPLKALSNAKYIEFSERFGPENVGILTGDRKENTESRIIVGTTEILRNQLYDSMHRGENINTAIVILDEAHYLGNEDRGVVWEEIMIYLPQRIPLLLLSATIGNARQIADWLAYIRNRNCSIIEETVRPVPLYNLFFHPSGTLYPLIEPKSTENRMYQKVKAYLKKPYYFTASPRALPPLGEVIKVLKNYNLLPAIFFLKSRFDCNRAVEMYNERLDEPHSRKQARNQLILDYIHQYPILADHSQMYKLRRLAVGAHHSGQLPMWKLIIEALMTRGLLDAVFATSTVAAGVNFPARTVVIMNSDRFNGSEFVPLDATQFHQMTGRAGRRGADQIGFAVTIPGKFMDLPLIVRLNHSPPSNIDSQIQINFSMVLNLLLSHTPSEINQLLEKSFATYLILKTRRLSHKKKKEARTRLWREFQRHLRFLQKENFVSEDEILTEDGIWTSQLRVDQPLLIAQGFRKQIFPKDDPAMLAAQIASFVNEKEFDDSKIEDLAPLELQENHQNMIEALRPLARRMGMHGFTARPLFLKPALTVYNWAKGESWYDVVKLSGLAEGDLAMMMIRTADNLRHTATLSEYFPEVADTSYQAISCILREPVIMDALYSKNNRIC
ncbi:MAG: DEAD/DEAH box helicase domain-containing protein [Candidatus Magnetoglobus multicellularis str. Araruama]|uniref:DEAD/DEAH box helicase domain-containing protein n=1 Tax=Candidatus Magnetoglobus multicellularis str. Araruama TaxID=890399 RepID=A0A1V1NZX1_9BACT|nr:MAG: DEAD/DEAH box helicase domain-containing protein [Candidatus Magnetoglobus multicellularis str. Araruama]